MQIFDFAPVSVIIIITQIITRAGSLETTLENKTPFYFIYVLFLAKQHEGSLFPEQGLNPCPQQWKRRVLITGSPGKSPELLFKGQRKVTGLRNATTEDPVCVTVSPCPYLGLHWLLTAPQMLVPLLFTVLPPLPHLFSEHKTCIAMLSWLWSLVWPLEPPGQPVQMHTKVFLPTCPSHLVFLMAAASTHLL